MDRLTIGQVAKSAGVHRETIRYYQSLGLVHEPARRPGSVRRYGPDAVARIVFIKRAQLLGFTLEEIAQLVPLEEGKDCAATRTLAEQKLALIKHRIAEFNRIRRSLEGLIAQCGHGRKACPIIAALSEGFEDVKPHPPAHPARGTRGGSRDEG